MSILDNLPVATLVALASIVVVVVACINNTMTVQEGLIALGAVAGGSGVLGIARAQSGKGVIR